MPYNKIFPLGGSTPSGIAGAIQFSNGSAFASDATKFFWDNTNKRLGIGTNAPTRLLTLGGVGTTEGAISFKRSSDGAEIASQVVTGASFDITVGAVLRFNNNGNNTLAATSVDLGARLGIKGSGSTSATTSLLVQNSGGSEALRVYDDRKVYIGTTGYFLPDTQSTAMYNAYNKAVLTSTEGSNIVKVLLANNTHSFLGSFAGSDGQVGINTNSPVASAVLEIVSTTKGFLPPRMTTTQKNAIASPATGLVVYDSTTNKLCCYNGSTWNDLF